MTASVGPDTDPIGLLEALATTRAIRRYTDAPIPDDDLRTILWHAGRAPSGSNRQPFRFLVLRDGPTAAAAKAAKPAARAPAATKPAARKPATKPAATKRAAKTAPRKRTPA